MKHFLDTLRAVLLLTACVLFTVRPALADRESTSLEYKVKAVVLFNFAKYVRWPEKTFESPTQPIRICIFGDNPFGEVFRSNEAPKEAQNRPLEVVEIASFADQTVATICQLLFWKESDEKHIKPIIPLLQSHSVLTVADEASPDALISFVLEDERVRFKIRHKAAQELGLNISSQLLKLAILEE